MGEIADTMRSALRELAQADARLYRGLAEELGDGATAVEETRALIQPEGGVPATELPGHYAMADVFAMPCRTRGAGLDVEGLGIVFLEAAAAGVPVVAGRSGGAPETVRDGETGRVVNGRAHEEIVDAITDLLSDPDRARLMGQAGRDWISRDWNWQTHSGRLAALLRVAPPR